MGCTQSNIENEEVVARCKDRKQHIRNAVYTRNAFAAAHSAYTVSLRETGAALSDYGQGEVHGPRSNQPHAQPPIEVLPPAPPPLPNFTQIPLQRATTMPELSTMPKYEPKFAERIQEEDDEAEIENDDDSHLIRRGSARTPEPETPQPPPSPPRTPPPPPSPPPTNPDPPLPPESKDSPYDFFFSVDMPGPSLSYPNEIRPQNDASDGRVYDDHYHRKENVIVDGDLGSKGGTVEPQAEEKVFEPEAVKPQPSKKSKQVIHSQAVAPGPVEVKRVAKSAPNVSLVQILNELDDHFLEASKSAHEVSKMLEANRLHYHSNFADNRGHIDHSARVMRVITWNRSFRGMPHADDGKDNFDAEEQETHATVLDKLLAWEKKLYDEVKAGEIMKIEYERKVALLNKQRDRGTNSEALEKTKAAVSHLHTRYIVDIQSLDSTVAEINRLRDGQLYPKLVELIGGMAKMWEMMYVHHDKQLKISAELKSLDLSQAPKETNEQHHEPTKQLWLAVQNWHTQFLNLVTHQKEYVRALNSWLKLNLTPIESSLKEKVSSPSRVPKPPIQTLLRAWNDHLENLRDELARTPISSFAAMVNTIMVFQEDEFKLKESCHKLRKELAHKERAFTEWREKYLQRKTPPDGMEADRAEDPNYKDPVVERQSAVEALQKQLEQELEAYQKHCRHVREKSLQNLKMHLPELFKALSDFALACSNMYKNLRSIAE